MQSEFTQVPKGTTLEQAAEMSKPGYVVAECAGEWDGEVMVRWLYARRRWHRVLIRRVTARWCG